MSVRTAGTAKFIAVPRETEPAKSQSRIEG